MKPLRYLAAAASLAVAAVTFPTSTARAVEIFNINDCEVKPQIVKSVQPDVPPNLRNQSGTVKVAFIISPEGRPINLEVEQSTNAALDDLALAAIQKWTFTPAERQGTRVAVKTMVPVRFKGA